MLVDCLRTHGRLFNRMCDACDVGQCDVGVWVSVECVHIFVNVRVVCVCIYIGARVVVIG